MFELINEVAVLGTTFLMMAIGTVWYSSMLFGNALPHGSGSSKENARLKIAVTFAAYFLMLSVLAYVLALAPILGTSLLFVLGSISVFVLSLIGSLFVLEHKSIREYLITSGFFVVFIIGGGLVLEYWPW
jgi:glucose uptake protein GlcU